MQTLRCHECGQILPAEGDHCPACGVRLIRQMALREPVAEPDDERDRDQLIAALIADEAPGPRVPRTPLGPIEPTIVVPAVPRTLQADLEGDVLPAPRRRWLSR